MPSHSIEVQPAAVNAHLQVLPCIEVVQQDSRARPGHLPCRSAVRTHIAAASTTAVAMGQCRHICDALCMHPEPLSGDGMFTYAKSVQELGICGEFLRYVPASGWQVPPAPINDLHIEKFSHCTLSRRLVAWLATCTKSTPAGLLGAPALQQMQNGMMIGATDFIGALTVLSTVYLSAHQRCY